MTQFLSEVEKWLIDNAGSFVFIGVTSLLTFFASWYTARYSWRAQKADQRRERIYAPLYDELTQMEAKLGEYPSPSTNEYEQIRSAHLLYLLPNEIENEIHDLYDVKLPKLNAIKVELYPNYTDRIIEQMRTGSTNPQVFQGQDADEFAGYLTIYVFEGKINRGREDWLRQQFEDLMLRGGRKGITLSGFFDDFLLSVSQDQAQRALLNLVQETLRSIELIKTFIKRDLKG